MLKIEVRMNASIFVGDIADADADALCTSTNPRLSLMMGTGASVRERGGSEVSRACEAIVAAKGPLPAGSAHATTAGRLPHKLVIHCVASDAAHRSSAEIVRVCVRNAVRIAIDAACGSLALPILAAGHASLRFDDALQAIAEELRSASLQRVVFVVNDPERAERARAIVRRVLGGDVEISSSTRVEPEPPSFD
jgi:O-acetyl-ADP-ribose deacetylase